ncbi:MAG TPA: signal peptidase II [bacterium]|nr:signal peptidase II [bacterium]
MLFNSKEKAVLVIAFFLLAADRLAKAAALQIWQFNEYPVFPGLKLSLAINKNIAFSLPLSGQLLTAAISALILILGYYWLISIKNKQSQIALLLTIMLINAINNLIDRFVYGGVIDYIHLQYFTVFNLADISICLASIALAIYLAKSSTLQSQS